MPSLTLDVALFSVFLALNLIVGLSYGRKVKTIQDYALGGKNFSTGTIAATIVATWYGGGALFRALETTYSQGLYYILPTLGVPIGLWLSGQLAVRMGQFLNNVSVAEALGDLYGKRVQIITAMSGIMANTGAVAIQFNVIARMLAIFFNFNPTHATLVAASIVIVYSSLGGIRAVTFTDVLQFFTFGMIIPVLALTIWNSVQDSTQITATLTSNPLFDFKTVVDWTPQFMSSLGLLLYFSIPGIYAPDLFQRISMAKNVVQAKNSLTYAAGMSLLISLLLAWLGMLLLAGNPGLESHQVVACMVNKYAGPGLRGLMAIGVTALAMSTADSCLNTSSVLFANDIVKPLTRQDKGKLINARVFAWLIGLGALCLALYSNDLLKILLLSGSLYMPIFTVPMLLAILGFRSTTRAVLLGMGAGFLTVVLWSIFWDNSNSIVPGMLANLIGLLGSHYLLREKGGWKKIAPTSPLALARQERKETWKRRIKTIKAFKLYSYLQQSLPKKEHYYLLFGFYIFAASYASLYTLSNAVKEQYQSIYGGIQYSILVVTTGFILYPLWPRYLRSKRLLTWIWPLSIGYALFFVGGIMAIMNGFEQVQVMIIMLNLVMSVLLLRWPLALILAASGVLIALYFFKYYTGLDTFLITLGTLQFRIIYGLLLFSSFLLALFKHKEAKKRLFFKNKSLSSLHEETIHKLLMSSKDQTRFINAFRTSGALELPQLVELSTEIVASTKAEKLTKSVISKINQLHEQLVSLALHLDKLDHRITGYLRLEVTTIPIDTLIRSVQEALHEKRLAKHITWKKMTQYENVSCDVDKIKTLLVHGVSFIRAVAGKSVHILIGLQDTQLGYAISAIKSGYIKRINALHLSLTTTYTLPTLEKLYLAQLNSEDTLVMPEIETDLPLVANARILKAHYGYLSNNIDDVNTLTQIYVIPKNIREIRSKDMDLTTMALETELIRADDTYPGAKEQEAAFLKAVQERTQADLKCVHKAIELIKQYHGPVQRNSGEPFYLHSLAVGHIVLDYNQDEATVLGALLHDTVEDTRLTLDQIGILFNKEVQNIVDGVTHLNSTKDTFYKIALSSYENVYKLLKVADQRVLYVKIADRMHNLRTIQYKSYRSQQRIAEETLLFFVPLAEQLGLKEASSEFRTLCLEILNDKRIDQE